MSQFINKGDSLIYTEAQISKRMRQLERQSFSKRDEEVLNRIQHGVNLGVYTPTEGEQSLIIAFQTRMSELVALATEARANNIFNTQLRDYRQATARLAQYALSEGRPEITEERPTGELDANGDPITETIVVQEAIAPLPMQIEQPIYDPMTGEQTGTELVDNPLIVADEIARASAQAIITSTPQDVIVASQL